MSKDEAQITMAWDDNTPNNKYAFDGPGGSLAATTASGVTFDSAERWELMDMQHPQRARAKFDGASLHRTMLHYTMLNSTVRVCIGLHKVIPVPDTPVRVPVRSPRRINKVWL